MSGMEAASTLGVEPGRPGRDLSSPVWLLGDPAPTSSSSELQWSLLTWN